MSKLNKAYKFRIYPNAEQAVMFAKTFGCVRFIYNKMLADKMAYYKETLNSGNPNSKSLTVTPAKYINVNIKMTKKLKIKMYKNEHKRK
jgi:putative transposase